MEIRFIGGAPALDLVNTVDPRIGDDCEELLATPEALSTWAAAAGLTRRGKPLSVGRAGFARVIAVREALYRVFAALARGRRPAAADLEHVRREYARALASATLERAGGAYVLRAQSGDENEVLFPVLASALELLEAPERLARLKECAAQDCGWLFLDVSRSGTRRWCRMGGCGAREKMARYRAKSRSL